MHVLHCSSFTEVQRHRIASLCLGASLILYNQGRLHTHEEVLMASTFHTKHTHDELVDIDALALPMRHDP